LKIPRVHVCFSPELYTAYAEDKHVVVVIDVLRATTAICVAIDSGAERVIPVVDVRVAKDYLGKGYIVGAERDGNIVDGFEYGNSPGEFRGDHVKGKTIVLTTSNGTYAIAAAQSAEEVAIGAFINLDAVVNWLCKHVDKEVILLCAGWKRKFNMEDTLFAGAVVDRLKEMDKVKEVTDSGIAALHLYRLGRDDLYGFLEDSSHRRRLRKLDITEDVIFSLSLNKTDVVPILTPDGIVKQ
jgi:2-phosphosulfolactate phosphatase